MLITRGKEITIEEADKVIFSQERIEIDGALLHELEANFHFLRDFASDKVIYGINTGFGPMAQHKIPFTERLTLQYNLIRSHAAGASKPITPLQSRAMLFDRLITFCQCKSGVHPDLVLLITDMLNADLVPVIYEHGGVGASGDLVQLAHMALAIIGEGELYDQGEKGHAGAILHKHRLTPFAIRIREGLAMMNGTSCMTGIGLINIQQAKKLLNWMLLLSASINELFEAFDDHIAEALNAVKLHQGQQHVAAAMRKLLEHSALLRNRKEYLYYDTEETHFKEKVQEYYSLRCIPQILGPVYDTIRAAEKTVVDELNSVSDNPVVDHDKQNIFHGGNFHGDYISLEMDKLKIAITKLSMMAERQLNYLLNDKLNGKLPPFINTGTIGLNFGLQGIQYTATSTVAEKQTLSNPVYVHSIPSNNDNQDIVSMGTNAALMAARVIDNSFDVLAVETMALMQAIDCLEKSTKLSAKPGAFYTAIRQISSPIDADKPRFDEVQQVAAYLKANHPNVI